MEKRNYKKLNGKDWSKKLGINILDWKPAFSGQEWTGLLLSKEDFMNRACLCVIEKPAKVPSRFEISKMKRKFNDEEID